MPKHIPKVPKPIWTKTKIEMCIELSSYMIIIYDDRLWWSSMMIVYDDRLWWSSMMIVYDDRLRWPSMMIVCDDRLWWSSVMIIMHDRLWWSSMMILIHDHHAWWSCIFIIWSYNRGHEGLRHIQWGHEGRVSKRIGLEKNRNRSQNWSRKFPKELQIDIKIGRKGSQLNQPSHDDPGPPRTPNSRLSTQAQGTIWTPTSSHNWKKTEN